MEYEPIIGLEVHAQLSCRSKVFCGCSAAYGAGANTRTCPVCLGLPGALPVLNRRAVEYALRLILAVSGRVSETSIMARKNYFYPDLPKGYQISQFERPLGVGGRVAFAVGDQQREVELIRIHLEEDAGKSQHGSGYSDIDLNRCGVPLLEIVSRPELTSPAEAAAFMQALRQLVRYLGICDGNMEEGSLRCDANVSVRPRGTRTLGTKTELKNMNSFKAVERALSFEIDRQINRLSHGREVSTQTLLWDESTGTAQTMRTKEESPDYRYFPEPDLLPVQVSYEWLEAVRRAMPELPAARRARFVKELELPEYDAALLTADRPLADYFEAVVKLHGAPKSVSNWVMGEVLRYLQKKGQAIESFPVAPEGLAALLAEVKRGAVSSSAAKDVLAYMVEHGGAPSDVIASLGLGQLSDRAELERVVRRVLADEAEQVQAYRAGKTRVFGHLVGQIMRATGGRAHPGLVNEILRSRLEGGES